jgi:molecular chaperone GrpE (heat shock protein)
MHQQQLIPIGTQDNARQDAHDDDTANEAEHPKAAADTEQAPRTRFAQRTPAHRPPGVLLKIISSHNDLVAQRDDEVKRLRAEMEQMRGRHKQEIKAFETQLFIQRANL